MKAALALRDIIITREHIVSPDFLAAYQDFPEAEAIAMAVSALEKEGTRTEYPLFGRPDLPIWIPSEHCDREDAREASAKAEYVFQAIADLLSQRYQIQPSMKVRQGKLNHPAKVLKAGAFSFPRKQLRLPKSTTGNGQNALLATLSEQQEGTWLKDFGSLVRELNDPMLKAIQG